MIDYLPSLFLVAIASVLLLSGCDLISDAVWYYDSYCEAFPEDCVPRADFN